VNAIAPPTRRPAGAQIRSAPPMYDRSTPGTLTEPSAFW
jgi:hypothetical protein